MKALLSTGLVPVRFLVASGPYSKGQIAGLDPATVKRLKSMKSPMIEEVDAPEGEETVDIDDNSLSIVPDSPSLGGYDHTPPLGSALLPGRNRFNEQPVGRGGNAMLEGPQSPKSHESAERGRFPGEDLLNGGDDAGAVGSPASTGSDSRAESQTGDVGATGNEPPTPPKRKTT